MKDITQLEIKIAQVENIKDLLNNPDKEAKFSEKTMAICMASVVNALKEVRNLLIEMDIEKAEIKGKLDTILKVCKKAGIIKDYGK